MRRKFFMAIAALFISATAIQAQDTYVATPVTISKEKVKFGDGVYYSHVVLERQTLFSICKAYGVTLQEVYDANPDLKLETEGLKKNSILRIPVKGESVKADSPKNDSAKLTDTEVQPEAQARTHTVKWYEDLEGIAASYGVTPEAIMEANGLSDSKLKARMKLIIPAAANAAEEAEENEAADNTETADTTTVSTTPVEEQETAVEGPAMKTEIKLALVLPLNITNGRGATNYMDFYAGAVLAARKAAEEGLHVELNVYDDASEMASLNSEVLASFDAVIGPVGKDNMQSLLAKAPDAVTMVSPLDPRTSPLADSHSNFFQAAPSSDDQLRDLADWIAEEKQLEDKVLIVAEKSKWATRNLLDSLLTARQVEHKAFAYSILEGRNIGSSLNAMFTRNGTNRIVIASESEAFVNDVIRNLNVAVHDEYPIVLYGPSKMKNYETIDITNYHNVNLHMSISYNVDYSDAKVKDFLLKYRAFYGTEPSNYAYQGYDLVTYFSQVCSKYGREWTTYTAGERTGLLQSSIQFTRKNNGGYVNTAVRRMVFNPDYSTSSIR